MQAADDLMRLKRIVRAQARAHGVVACFMAKPNENYAGSGMHFHVSMLDGAGKNVFVEADEGKWNPTDPARAGRPEARRWRESMLVFAPARQLLAPLRQPDLRAGVSPTWGVNNRSVALRIPAGDIKARRIEHRPAGRGRQPLSGGGHRAGRHPPRDARTASTPARKPPATAMRTRRAAAIPTDWKSAIDAAKRSAFLKDALGEDMHRTFTAIKAAEYARVMRTVSEVDFDLYLHTV